MGLRITPATGKEGQPRNLDTRRRGPGNDVVSADPRDIVAGDCEQVRR
jgi:hypothetical protein